jgi:hypothetical protein
MAVATRVGAVKEPAGRTAAPVVAAATVAVAAGTATALDLDQEAVLRDGCGPCPAGRVGNSGSRRGRA